MTDAMDTLIMYKPFEDAEYTMLSQDQRDRVRKWIWIFEQAPASLPTTGKNSRFLWMATMAGCTEATARRLFYAYKRSGDWHVLMDGRSASRKRLELTGHRSERFRAWVAHKCERNQRCHAAAFREIERAFWTGREAIPGYEDWIPNGRTLPPRVNKSTLYRIMREHRYEMQNVRVSLKANKAHLASVYTTRADVPVGRIIQMDDMWHDHGIVHKGQVVRVLEFGIVDVASACRVHWGTIPRVVRDDGTKEGLCKKLFIALVGYYCRYIGVHPEGTIMQMEHGTATLDKRHASLLEDSWGMVKVEKGGLHGHKQAKLGGYKGRPMGNPAYKGIIESLGSLIHNELAGLAAQFGKSRDYQPDATNGLIAYQAQIKKWEDALLSIGREDLAMALQSPAMTYHQFGQILSDVYNRINARTDHELEGWQNRTALEFQIAPGQWVAQSEVRFADDAQRDMFLRYAETNPGLIRERRMSPQEVWDAGKDNLIKMPLSLYVDFIGGDGEFGREATVRKRVITVKDRFIANGEPLIYEAVVYLDGHKRMLSEGESYRVVLNPYNINALVVLDGAGKILGEAPLYVRVSRLDRDGIARRIGHQSHLIEQDTALQQARYAQDNADTQDLHERNRQIAIEAGLASLTGPRKRKAAPAPVSDEDFDALIDAPAAPTACGKTTDFIDLSDLY